MCRFCANFCEVRTARSRYRTSTYPSHRTSPGYTQHRGKSTSPGHWSPVERNTKAQKVLQEFRGSKTNRRERVGTHSFLTHIRSIIERTPSARRVSLRWDDGGFFDLDGRLYLEKGREGQNYDFRLEAFGLNKQPKPVWNATFDCSTRSFAERFHRFTSFSRLRETSLLNQTRGWIWAFRGSSMRTLSSGLHGGASAQEMNST